MRNANLSFLTKGQLETSLQLLGVLLIFPWIDDPSDADPYDGNGYGNGNGNGYGNGNGLRLTQKF